MNGYKMYGRLMTAVVIFHAVADHIKNEKYLFVGIVCVFTGKIS